LKIITLWLVFVALFLPDKGWGEMKISIIYDNYAHREGMETDWGFSCFIEGAGKNILFDTGTRGSLFLSNYSKMGFSLEQVDMVVLSHEHGDHIGGLEDFLQNRNNNNIPIYFPASFSRSTIALIKDNGARPVPVSEPLNITGDIVLSGELGTQIREISLGIHTSGGLVVITGCSHPGIIEILGRFKEITGEKLYLALGGFHLRDQSTRQMAVIIDEMRSLGLQKCGPTHCTGDIQIESIRQAFGKDFIRPGTGKIIRIKN
jgi:7,8-dihydropterin-6-yl-methyl-4-(beta-D-ribofuranosyl)aminobenzene 5'-phosphate synthase